MKRVVSAVIGLALGVAVGPNMVGATLSPGNGPDYDLAQGTGKISAAGFEGQFRVIAKSGPAGEDAQGYVLFQADSPTPNSELRGRVTCLAVTGNQATIGGELDTPFVSGSSVFSGFALGVVDNGQGGNAPADQAVATFSATPPAVCPPLPSLGQPFQQGNFVVHDAMP
jgi:hypothetical protein